MAILTSTSPRAPRAPGDRRAGRPQSPDEWVALAHRTALRLSHLRRTRDRLDVREQVAAVADAGLTTLIGPAGDGSEPGWPGVHRVVRAIAAHDPALARLVGHHHLWTWVVAREATSEHAESIRTSVDRLRWLLAGPADPSDGDVRAREEGRHLVLNGRHRVPAGSAASDVVFVDGLLEDGTRCVAALPSRHPGITFHDDADDHDHDHERPAGYNTVCVAEARIPRSQALRPAAHDRSQHVTEFGLTGRLMLANVALGRARTSLADAVGGTRHQLAAPSELRRYAALAGKLRAAEALADQLAQVGSPVARAPGEHVPGDGTRATATATLAGLADEIVHELTGGAPRR